MNPPPELEPCLAVLHLEDSALDAEILREQLAGAGLHLRLDWAANAPEFEDFLRRGAYDLVLADYQLPGFDAPAALKLVGLLRPGTPFLCVSGAIGEDGAADLIKQGAADFVRKDRLDRLPMAMRRALDEAKQRQERFAAEVAARNHEQVYASVVEDLPHCVFRKDTEGRFTFANQHFCDIVGRPRTELLGKPDAELFPSDLASKYQADDRHVMSSGAMLNTVEERRLPNGVKHHVQVIKYPLRDAELNVVGVQGVLWDITERKRMEDALREKTRLVENIIASVQEGVVVYDRHLRYQIWNPFMERISGLPAANVIGRLPLEVFPLLRESGVMERLERALAGETPGAVDFPYTVPETGRSGWTSDASSPLRNTEGEVIGVIATVRDITERKQAEAEKSRLEAQFHQAQKMESVGQLAGGVAHDFNNILAATMMHLSFLRENPSFDLDTRASLDELMEETKRAAGLTRQLLMFSRRSVLEVKVLDLNEVVANLLKMLGRLIGEHISFRFDLKEDLPPVKADPGMVEQVLMNLAVNARDAMPHGGRLTIRTELVQLDAAGVEANTQAQTGRFVCLSVADTGCGMDEATRQRIFEPFFTTKEPGQGTGLGLATVHGIVAQHQGWIEVETQVGKGTTFKVFLPATTQETTAPTPAATMAALRGHETILLVEDEASLRRAVAESLRRLGYRLLEAANGREAIQLWQEHGQAVDLLFSDMVMPEGLTGLDLAEKLKGQKPELKVIISSGYNADMAGQGRPATGGIVYLQKPYPIEVLSKIIRDCLEQA